MADRDPRRFAGNLVQFKNIFNETEMIEFMEHVLTIHLKCALRQGTSQNAFRAHVVKTARVDKSILVRNTLKKLSNQRSLGQH